MTAPVDSAGTDTSSPEWMLTCLARHICRMPGRPARLSFMDLLRKRHSAEFIQLVEQKVRTEWKLMHNKLDQTKAAHGDA